MGTVLRGTFVPMGTVLGGLFICFIVLFCLQDWICCCQLMFLDSLQYRFVVCSTVLLLARDVLIQLAIQFCFCVVAITRFLDAKLRFAQQTHLRNWCLAPLMTVLCLQYCFAVFKVFFYTVDITVLFLRCRYHQIPRC